jgi:hypothetical protein
MQVLKRRLILNVKATDEALQTHQQKLTLDLQTDQCGQLSMDHSGHTPRKQLDCPLGSEYQHETQW